MQYRNLTEGLEISSVLSSGSYRKVKYKRMRVSRSGMLIVHNLLCSGPSPSLDLRMVQRSRVYYCGRRERPGIEASGPYVFACARWGRAQGEGEW